MDKKIMEIQRDLQEKYLASFGGVTSPEMKQMYEMIVKLNAEMIAEALQRYKDEVK